MSAHRPSRSQRKSLFGAATPEKMGLELLMCSGGHVVRKGFAYCCLHVVNDICWLRVCRIAIRDDVEETGYLDSILQSGRHSSGSWNSGGLRSVRCSGSGLRYNRFFVLPRGLLIGSLVNLQRKERCSNYMLSRSCCSGLESTQCVNARLSATEVRSRAMVLESQLKRAQYIF